MKSASASALTAPQLKRARQLIEAFPIELAELRASPKQLSFQRTFFDRQGDDGRRVDIFVALGGNRSEVLTRLSRHPARMPAIVVSGHASPEDRQAAVALGAVAFFAKPFNPDGLLKVIAAVCS